MASGDAGRAAGDGFAAGGRTGGEVPPESQLFAVSYRAAVQDGGGVLAYSQHVETHTAGQARFDSAAVLPASTDHVALACLTDLLQAVQEAARRVGLDVEEAEGLAELQVSEPLFLAGVKGFDEPARIAGVRVRLYVCVDCPPEEFDALCEQALRCSPVYLSLQDAFPFEVRFMQEA